MSGTVGRGLLAVLLMQDLAVIPILVLAGILTTQNQTSVVVGLVLALVQAAVMTGLIIGLGRLLLRPLFRHAAGAGGPELFMAATLLVAIGISVLTATAGLSMALGGFMAGLLLVETEYRKAIEAAMQPFKGLLLGVFFISVGTQVDLVAILKGPVYFISCAIGLVAAKAVIAAGVARLYGFSPAASAEIGLLLGPGGEFAFIVIGIASATRVIDAQAASLLVAVVGLTMAAIPLLGSLGERLAEKLTPTPATPVELMEMPPSDVARHAIVVGCGRVGKLVSEMLGEHGIQHLITEKNANAVVEARAEGRAVYYGDGKDPAFLDKCGIASAKVLIITVAKTAEIDEVLAIAHRLRPDLPVIARARDAVHARRLYQAGVTDAVPETIEASLQLSEAALVAAGVPTGPAIASIHEKRDGFRRTLQGAQVTPSRPIRGLRASARGGSGRAGNDNPGT